MTPKNTINHSDFHILFASRLVYEKGADILLDCIESSLSRSRFPRKIIWHILSTWPYTYPILALAKKYPGIVYYHGNIFPKEIAYLYRTADLLFMPSRFLETFWLTALESVSSGTPVCGFRKWWLIPFIPHRLALSEENPIESFLNILEGLILEEKLLESDLSLYSQQIWRENLTDIVPIATSVFIVHDYTELIGWAEYYVKNLLQSLEEKWSPTLRYSYTWDTTIWKRRWMFIFSFLAFWRGSTLKKMLHAQKPEIIWMHSVLRYAWYWWVRAVTLYARKTWAKVYLSHHDIWWIVPFPQDITDESQIPHDISLFAWISWISGIKKIFAVGKWCYIRLIKSILPENTEHIIFAPFLEPHIRRHFPHHKIRIFPHSVDETIFYP